MNLDSAIPEMAKTSLKMIDMADSNKFSTLLLSYSFFFRPVLKYFIIGCSIILISVLSIYGFKGFRSLLETVSSENLPKKGGSSRDL